MLLDISDDRDKDCGNKEGFYNNLIRLRPLNEAEATFPKLGEGISLS